MYRVFLVDDEEITLAQTAETVPWPDNGFEVCGTETDPLRAVERICEERPEVVFLDLKMPGMDGHELMRRVNDRGVQPEFVMLSAYGDFEDARTFFRQRGFDYLLKPLNENDVELILDGLTRKLSAKYTQSAACDDLPPTMADSFSALVSYIRENYGESFTLEKLGKRFGISGSYICALFAKKYNTSLSSFVTGLRMENAARRIRAGGEPLKSIALSCGYKDYYYFSKMFKAYYGMSPTEFKNSGGAD